MLLIVKNDPLCVFVNDELKSLPDPKDALLLMPPGNPKESVPQFDQDIV
jgi:hypothetical protein